MRTQVYSYTYFLIWELHNSKIPQLCYCVLHMTAQLSKLSMEEPSVLDYGQNLLNSPSENSCWSSVRRYPYSYYGG